MWQRENGKLRYVRKLDRVIIGFNRIACIYLVDTKF